ncbi:hypothetical protein [Epilithonimonas vandammei]|uniref:hypothetical protein n=1 Tax=Epilithonimonas vandammei TaxID=2487072 RepID=UPI0028A2BD42|nr:hypothetical protein [Epilithonimonas vandammei]
MTIKQSVKGQHYWVKKINDKTIELTINLQEMMDKNHQFKNKDEIILIETE